MTIDEYIKDVQPAGYWKRLMTRVWEETEDVDDISDLREDLALFDYALEHGWEAWTKGPVIHGLPHDKVSYLKGNVHLWGGGEFDIYKHPPEPSEYRSWWTAADLIDNKFQNHRKYDTLKEVIDNEGKQS